MLMATLGADREDYAEATPRGHKLFVADNEQTHEAIKRFQAFIYLQRQIVQNPDSTRPMTFHGLRHTKAADRYQEFIQEGKAPTRPGRPSQNFWVMAGTM